MTAAPRRFLTFRAAGRLQAVPADAVREVIRRPVLTRVPQAPAGLVGLANVRGAAVPVVSVTALQGGSAAGGERLMLLDRADPVGLLVDEVREIVDQKGRIRTLDVEALLGLALRSAPARATGARAAAARGHGMSAPERAGETAVLDLLSFLVGGQEFALPLDQVAEVIAFPADIARLPDADGAVIGTVHHRGALLPLLALAALLALPDKAAEAATRVIVVRLRGHRVGLAVASTRSIVGVGDADVDPVPTVIARRTGEARIQAIARLDDGRRLISILAAEHLLSDALLAHMPERPDDRSKEQAEMTADTTEPLLIFRLGAQSFALPAAAVEEIVRVPETLTRLPKAPSFVDGVMNLRGHAIPVIDQRRRFDETVPPDRPRRAIVVRLGALRAAFAVDEVTEIRRLDGGRVAPAPAISDETRLFDRTATMADGSIVLMIEPAELLDGTERALLTSLQADATTSPT